MADPVAAVLFDLDDTLVRYRRSPETLLRESFDAVGVDPVFPVKAYYDRFDEFAERTDSMRELREECFAALCAERDRDPDLGREVASAYADARDHRDVAFLPGARDVLDAFAAEYRLGIVTNGARDAQAQKIDAVGLDSAVDVVVFAGHDAPPKPAPEPFHRALDALEVGPEAAVHVGNSLDSDVAGAAAAGIRSVWLAGGDAADGAASAERTDHVVESLAELSRRPWLEK
ncbi:HAD family hydrolase [Halobellus sp. EA9]|uniref:HAD family hydrolase n=1 Tax=Halobellus sp. EA9 TaxID=3421647 RepID=UPI003EC012DD